MSNYPFSCIFYQGENPVSLAIGTQVSAKYKGAFCEAKVRSVIKEVKCRITFKGGLGSCTLSDEAIQPIDDQPIIQGANVKAKHPDKQDYFDAVINQIKVGTYIFSTSRVHTQPGNQGILVGRNKP